MQQNKLIIFSAPSGAGKTTIVHHLLNKFPEQLAFSVSACSRPMRKGEVEGVDYHFLTIDEFKKRIAAGEFVEWEEVYTDSYYGTLKKELERIWRTGKNVIFDVDVKGGLNLKKQFGEKALAIFVMPPSISALEQRLKHRETETPQAIINRMEKAQQEMTTAIEFDRIIVNDNLENAFKDAEKVVAEFLAQE